MTRVTPLMSGMSYEQFARMFRTEVEEAVIEQYWLPYADGDITSPPLELLKTTESGPWQRAYTYSPDHFPRMQELRDKKYSGAEELTREEREELSWLIFGHTNWLLARQSKQA